MDDDYENYDTSTGNNMAGIGEISKYFDSSAPKPIEDTNFSLDITPGFDQCIIYNYQGSDFEGIRIGAYDGQEFSLNEISKLEYHQTSEEMNKIEGLEPNKEYRVFRVSKGKGNTLTNYGKFMTFAKPAKLIDNEYKAAEENYNIFGDLKIKRKFKSKGIQKVKIGLLGQASEGKSCIYSSLQTIKQTQDNPHSKDNIDFDFQAPEKPCGKNSIDIQTFEDFDKIDFYEFPQFYDESIDDSEIPEEMIEKFEVLHSLIVVMDWTYLRHYSLYKRYEKIGKNNPKYEDFVKDSDVFNSLFNARLEIIKLARKINKNIPITIALTKIDTIDSDIKKFSNLSYHPYILEIKDLLESELPEKIDIIPCSSFFKAENDLEPSKYYSKSVSILTLVLSAFEKGLSFLQQKYGDQNDVSENDPNQTEDTSLSQNLYWGTNKVIGKIPDYDPNLTTIYYNKKTWDTLPQQSEIRTWPSHKLRDENYLISDLEKGKEYVFVLQNEDEGIEKEYGKCKLSDTETHRIDDISKEFRNKVKWHRDFRVHSYHEAAGVRKIKIGIFGLENSGKSSMIATLKTVMKLVDNNSNINCEIDYEYPTTKAGVREKVKRTDFEHNKYYCATEYPEIQDHKKYTTKSKDITQRIHSAIFTIEASVLKRLVDKERKLITKKEEANQLKDIYDKIIEYYLKIKAEESEISIIVVVSKVDEIFVECQENLTYNDMIEHPYYLAIRSYIENYLGHNVKIFPCISLFQNPYLEYENPQTLKETDPLLSNILKKGYMILDIFRSALEDGIAFIKRTQKCIALVSELRDGKEKIEKSFFVERSQNIERWKDLKHHIEKHNFKGKLLDREKKAISEKADLETREVAKIIDESFFRVECDASDSSVISILFVFKMKRDEILEDFVNEYSNIKDNLSLTDFRSMLEDQGITPEVQENFCFSRLKTPGMNPTSSNDFDMIEDLSKENSLTIKDIIFNLQDDQNSYIEIVSFLIMVEIYDDTSKSVIKSLPNLNKRNENLSTIRKKAALIDDYTFLRIDKVKDKDLHLIIKSESESRYSLDDAEICVKQGPNDSYTNIYRIFVQRK